MDEIAKRFRGFLPVVVDVETGGFNPETDALLEIAACIIEMDEKGWMYPGETLMRHVEPFPGANLDPRALEFNGIRPDNPLRGAVDEREALKDLFRPIRRALRTHGCQRAILVGHNPAFDLSFVNAAIARTGYKRNPFHLFSTFDTATLGGLMYGQTVLSRAMEAAELEWNQDEAHSALYDTERTAELFCTICNRLKRLEQQAHGRVRSLAQSC